MAKVEMMDVMVAMAKAILEVAGETTTTQVEEEKKADKPAKKEKVEKAAKANPEAEQTDDGNNADLENKTTKELYQMCVDAGIKVPKYGKNKQFYIEQLTGGTQPTEDDAETEEAEEEQADEYAGKTAKELFELCKKRGIKAAPKKKADVYIKMLKEADAAAAEAEAEDDDDWGDEEEETTKPAKKAKPKAAAKKAPAKAEEDDDDDWDI